MPDIFPWLADFLAWSQSQDKEIRSQCSSSCSGENQLCGNCDNVLSDCATMAKALMGVDTAMTFRAYVGAIL